MSNEQKIRIGITHGDTNGVGYEVIMKCFTSSDILELCTPIVYGSSKIMNYHRKALGIQTIQINTTRNAGYVKDNALNVVETINEDVKIDLLNVTAATPYYSVYAQRPSFTPAVEAVLQPDGSMKIPPRIDPPEDPLFGWLNKNVKSDGTPYDLDSDGLRIYTTINLRMQRYAEEAIVEHLSKDLQKAFFKELSYRKNAPFSSDVPKKTLEVTMRQASSQP